MPKQTPVLVLKEQILLPQAVQRFHLQEPEDLAAVSRLRASEFAESEVLVRANPLKATAQEPPVAVRSRILERHALADGSELILLQGLERVRLDDRGGWVRSAATFPHGESARPQIELCLTLVDALVATDPRLPRELFARAHMLAEVPERLADQVAVELNLSGDARRRLFFELDPLHRLKILEEELSLELQRVRRRIEERQGQGIGAQSTERMPGTRLGGPSLETHSLEVWIERTPLPPAARRHALRELVRLRLAPPGSYDAGRIRTWLEWMLELPWAKTSTDPGGPKDFARVAEELDRSHVGLREVKDRIIEFLAVHRLSGTQRGSALCFLGPPGTGKTSMGKAVAQALGRQFVHIPVGGISDESQLRGLHFSQQDSMPGLILQGIHRAGTRNPVILLDEIDKVQLGANGEAGGVLLEILDPEQNRVFIDPFLDVPFDLSQCVFFATANDTEQMPEALLDRLEVIDFASYSETEKLQVAYDHLLPRARAWAGLNTRQLRLSQGALLGVVRRYTEEAGVRQLQRMIDSLARKAALRVVRGEGDLSVRKADLLDLLGPAIVDEELLLKHPRVGVCLGLAWTSAGGALLPIECVAVPGSGRLTLTGSLGDVIRESVQTALSYVRGCFRDFGLSSEALDNLDLHLHFPSGGTPKDGPSAGLAIVTSLISLLTKTPVRHDVAVTGEISLHGEVLPAGGLRDKLLAALRAGVRTVILPSRNAEEVLRLPADVRRKLTIHLVEHAREALAKALVVGQGSALSPVLAMRPRARRRARGRRRRKGSKGAS
jgi:ATP-dependent Lon protease